jgi:hypothetical protein
VDFTTLLNVGLEKLLTGEKLESAQEKLNPQRAARLCRSDGARSFSKADTLG